MKIIIVDTNIVFSSILNPKSKIGDLILNSKDCLSFYCPSFLRVEIEKHKEKISEISGLSFPEIDELKSLVFSHLVFISEEQVPFKIWYRTAELLREIDSDDVAFVAVSEFMDEQLWTGDKKLIKGLISKGFTKLISTKELYALREKLRKE